MHHVPTLPANTLVVVRYGTKGEQIAQLLAVPTRSDIRLVRKWLKNSRRWTNAVRIAAPLVLRQATAADVKRFNPGEGF